MPRDILIVDDIKSALENFGNEVKLNLNIEPFLADDPRQALDILHYYPIKVLVTDQNMPFMTGTELVRKVKDELGLRIPCIMLTGYTDTVSVVDAVNLGFFRFIDKINVHTELTPAIRQALQRYEMDKQSDSTMEVNKLLTSKSLYLNFKKRVDLRLVRISSIAEPFIREQDWNTELIAQRNLHDIREVIISRKVSSMYEYGVNATQLHKAGFKLGKLIGELESALQNKISLFAKGKYERILEIKAKHTIETKEITDNPTAEGLILQSREYQAAPVFTRINCVLQVECNCCEIPKSFDMSIDLPTNKFALRQVEHYDKGQTKIVYTGFSTGSIELESKI